MKKENIKNIRRFKNGVMVKVSLKGNDSVIFIKDIFTGKIYAYCEGMGGLFQHPKTEAEIIAHLKQMDAEGGTIEAITLKEKTC